MERGDPRHGLPPVRDASALLRREDHDNRHELRETASLERVGSDVDRLTAPARVRDRLQDVRNPDFGKRLPDASVPIDGGSTRWRSRFVVTSRGIEPRSLGLRPSAMTTPARWSDGADGRARTRACGLRGRREPPRTLRPKHVGCQLPRRPELGVNGRSRTGSNGVHSPAARRLPSLTIELVAGEGIEPP